MLILDDEGYITGHTDAPDTARSGIPAPFAAKGAKWDGAKWTYDKLEATCVPASNVIRPDTLSNNILSVLDLPCGTENKAKTTPTVLVPCYDKAEYVVECVKSVAVQDEQLHGIIVLLMDDDSKAKTDELSALSSKVKCVSHDRLNVSAARNLLVELCETEFFIFVDADDTLPDNFVSGVMSCEASIVGVAPYNSIKRTICRRFDACCGNMTGLLHKEAWNEVGGLREDLCDGGEDSYFWVELFKQRKWLVDFCNDTYFNYNISVPGQLTGRPEFVESKRHELELRWDFYKDSVRRSVNFMKFDVMRDMELYERGLQVTEDEAREAFEKAMTLFNESAARECPVIQEGPFAGQKADVIIYAAPCLKYDFDNGLYDNYSGADVTLPMHELLAKYNVQFRPDLTDALGALPYLGDKDAEIHEVISRYGKMRIHRVALALFSDCDKTCGYCSQKGWRAHVTDWDGLYEKFDAIVTKFEETIGKEQLSFRVMGGELMLAPDWFLDKVCERLSWYSSFEVATNGRDYGERPMHGNPAVKFHVHLTDAPYEPRYSIYDTGNIVVNKEDLGDILALVESGQCERRYVRFTPFGCPSSDSERHDKYALTDDDMAALDAALKEHGLDTVGDKYIRDIDACMAQPARDILTDCSDMTVTPCCGFGQKKYGYLEWNMQQPDKELCAACHIRY